MVIPVAPGVKRSPLSTRIHAGKCHVLHDRTRLWRADRGSAIWDSDTSCCPRMPAQSAACGLKEAGTESVEVRARRQASQTQSVQLAGIGGGCRHGCRQNFVYGFGARLIAPLGTSSVNIRCVRRTLGAPRPPAAASPMKSTPAARSSKYAHALACAPRLKAGHREGPIYRNSWLFRCS